MRKKLRIKIIGAGPTGLLCAISLAKIGCEVKIYDLKSKNQLINRDRAYAISHSSRRFFQSIDIWDTVNLVLNPFSHLTLTDSESNEKVIFNKKDLNFESQKYNSIGWISEHSKLVSTLFKVIDKLPQVELLLETNSDDNSYNYDFKVAADGLESPCRKSSKINIFKFRYKQSCLTTKVLIRSSNDNSAFEILRSEGPFAVLPIRGDLYQIVWSGSSQDCAKRIRLSRQTLLNQIAGIIPNGYEPDAIVGDVLIFPVFFLIAFPFFYNNFILIGEAAHSFHPIGGQGLNLCWRDVQILTNKIKSARNNKIPLRYLALSYNLNRFIDVSLVAITTDIMIRLYSNDSFILLFLKKSIVKCLNSSRKLRKFVLHIMTIGLFKLN